MQTKIKRALLEAGLGFILWAAILSPYMLFVMRLSATQYRDWFIMQAMIVPPVAVVVLKVTNLLVKKLLFRNNKRICKCKTCEKVKGK